MFLNFSKFFQKNQQTSAARFLPESEKGQLVKNSDLEHLTEVKSGTEWHYKPPLP